MLTSQGDEEQIFVADAGGAHRLAALKLSSAVDDTAWPSGAFGAIYATDSSNDTINRITGPFRRGSVFVTATPCGASDAPRTCPDPGFPGNYLGELNPRTGVITRVHIRGPAAAVGEMVFLGPIREKPKRR